MRPTIRRAGSTVTLRDDRHGEAKEEARRDYERSLAKFQASEGTIENAFWCVFAPSAVALTVKPHPRLRRLFGDRWPGRADDSLAQRDRLADE